MIIEVYHKSPNDKQFRALCYTSGNYFVPFYIRIKYALLYLFKPDRYQFDNIIFLDERHTETIIDIGKALEEIKAMSDKDQQNVTIEKAC
jgi:hypothetical protein